jgi:hypothetical protein
VRVEAVVVERVEVPETVSMPPAIREVIERLGLSAIVEVLERTMLAPAVRNDAGEL